MDAIHRPQRRRPTIAKDWQLAVLKKLQSESGNPTEQQRTAAAAETGLDEKWVRNWFTRQRSKLAKKTTKPHYAANVPTFKLKLPPPSPVPMPTYSRDPLYNRYPDFSQFFRPDVHERFCTQPCPVATFAILY